MNEAPAHATSPIVADVDQIIQRHLEPLLKRIKQSTLEVIEELGQKHGNRMLGELKQTVIDTVKSQVVDQLRPLVTQGGDTAKQKADSLLLDFQQFIKGTVAEVFQKHVPQYSAVLGQRVLDYVVAGILLGMGAVMGCVGALLSLDRIGVPTYMSFLVISAVSLAGGFALLRLRAWTNPGALPAPALSPNPTGSPPAPAAVPKPPPGE
jgi:hypothetical protein